MSRSVDYAKGIAMELLSTRRVAAAVVAVFLTGCAVASNVMSKGDDLYTISVYRGDAGKVKMRAYQHAQKFCAQKGARVQVVNENLRVDTSYANKSSSIIDLDFKCVK